MAGSSNNTDTGALYFGTVNPTLTGQEVDNDSFIVTSDGTPNGTIISFWKFDEETLTWVIVPSGDLNNDRVLYTGNTTIPTLAPPKGVDTAVLSNGTRYDWDGTVWVLVPQVVLDGNERKLARANSTPSVAPTALEIPTPINGDTATIQLLNNNIEHWNYTAGAWVLVFTQVVATFDSTVDFNTANPNTGGTVFTPNTPASTTVLYVSSVDGSQWTYNGTTYITAPVSSDWKVTGNAGTVQATNFVGTTDNVGLSFRTNNTIRQTITNTGNVGIGTTTPTSILHVNGSEAGTIINITTTTTLNETHHKVLVRNGATNITITLPNALTCLGREYIFSRAAGSTGSITIVGSGTQIQALNGTLGATTSIGAHGTTGQGLRHSFTAINIGGVGSWVRI